MIRINEMKGALETWLNDCPCEICGEKGGTYLFLTPASLRFRSVLSFLSILRNRFGNTDRLIAHLQSIIRLNSDQYDYQSTAPILCSDCARGAELEIDEEYRVAYPSPWSCEQCKKLWDPLRDSTRGAGLRIEEQLLCEQCALDILRKQNVVEVKIQDGKKKKSNREANIAFQEEYLEGKTCETCGSNELPILTLQKTESSPAGKIGGWRHGHSPKTFEQEVRTCRVVCKQCLQENGDLNGG